MSVSTAPDKPDKTERPEIEVRGLHKSFGGVEVLHGVDLEAMERGLIEGTLKRAGQNKSKAAKRLGLSRTQLYVRLRKYDLDQPPAA